MGSWSSIRRGILSLRRLGRVTRRFLGYLLVEMFRIPPIVKQSLLPAAAAWPLSTPSVGSASMGMGNHFERKRKIAKKGKVQRKIQYLSTGSVEQWIYIFFLYLFPFFAILHCKFLIIRILPS